MPRQSPASAAALAVLATLSAAPAGAADLVLRPDDEAGLAQRIERHREDGPRVGWNALLNEELIANSAYAAGSGPWLAVTGAPYLASTFHLRSRTWALERGLGAEAARARHRATRVEAADGLVFGLVIFATRRDVLAPDDLRARYADGSGLSLPASVDDVRIGAARTLGGEVFTAHARLAVDLPEGYDWSGVEEMELIVQHDGSAPYRLAWSLPEPG